MDCFYNDVAIMMKVSSGCHPNVVSMEDRNPEQPNPAVIKEHGLDSLHSFLSKYKNEVRA